MKVLLPVLTLLLLGSDSSGQDRAASFVEKHGQLAVQGTLLVDREGETVVLRGVSFGWHVWWPQFWNDQFVEWSRDDWHRDVPRAAMGVEPRGGYLHSPRKSQQLVETVGG